MLGFLRDNARWLGAGFLLTFSSAFGQTWFISLFASEIKTEFGLSDGGWGTLYTVATLSSAAMMFWLGSLADKISLARLAPAITLLFAAAALGFSLSNSIIMLCLAVFILRFCGQGMYSHMAMTAMGRWFEETRGRAVSITLLGHPAGEVALPLLTVFAITTIGWSTTWMIVSAILVVVIAPTLRMLLLNDRSPVGHKDTVLTPGLGGRHWTRLEATKHWLLPALIPMLLTPGFISTVIFFHQAHIADIKAWTLLQMAPGYTFYASATVGSSFLLGWVSDRFGVMRLLPLILVPMGAGILLIGTGEALWTWYAALALCGLTQGSAGAFWGVFLPVAYGTRYLGAIRSLTTTVMVISTAIGPGITGLFIDGGVNFATQSLFMCVWCIVFSGLSFAITNRMNSEG